MLAIRCNAFSGCCGNRKAGAVRCVGRHCVLSYAARFGPVHCAVTTWAVEGAAICPSCYTGRFKKPLEEDTPVLCQRCCGAEGRSIVAAIERLTERATGAAGRLTNAQQTARKLLTELNAANETVDAVEEASESPPPPGFPAAAPSPPSPDADAVPEESFDVLLQRARGQLFSNLQAIDLGTASPTTATIDALKEAKLSVTIGRLTVSIPIADASTVTAACKILFKTADDTLATDLCDALEEQVKPAVKAQMMEAIRQLEARADEHTRSAKRLRRSMEEAAAAPAEEAGFTINGTQLMV